jgi:hypothetical protein
VGKIETTLALMGASWDILKKDREILFLPVISGICCLAITTILIVQALDHEWLKHLDPHSGIRKESFFFLFLFYYFNYLVIIFFNSAIITCAIIRMEGGNPTLGDGLQAAVNRFPQIAFWALIASTVGMVLGMIESRSNRVRCIVSSVIGIAWSLVSYLAIPLIVVEKTNPLVALDRSLFLMQQTWGEQVIGNFSFGLIFTILYLPILPLILIVNRFWGAHLLLPIFVGAVLYLILLGIFQSALQTVFNAVMYLYARDGKIPGGFSTELLQNAMRSS